MILRSFTLALAFTSSTALAGDKPAMTAAQEARALIGLEYTSSTPGEQIAPGRLSCMVGGGGAMLVNGVDHHDWSINKGQC